MRRRTLEATLAVALAAAPGAAAQDATPAPTIRVEADALVLEAPERAELELAVVTEAHEATEAARANAARVEAVLAAVRAAVGEEATVTTRGYALEPRTDRPRAGAPAAIVGYRATNHIRLADVALDAVGPAIDRAIAAGANRVESLRFTLVDEEAARLRALREAARRARGRAEALADALDLDIDRILHVEQGAAHPVLSVGLERVEAMAAAAPTTPIEPGEVEIRASVRLVVAVRPRER